MDQYTQNRRTFIRQVGRNVGLVMLGAQVVPILSACNDSSQADEKTTDTAATRMSGSEQKKLGIALVGLGKYAGGQLAPALKETKHCYLAGIVTGTPGKAKDWKKKYDIPDKNIYNYDNFDTIKDNPDIDIVYVVLPNALHADFVVRAAKAGKHVICEKPMAITVEECDRMIAACKEAGKQLSIGYRLHFEPHNQEIMRLGTQKTYGNLKTLKLNDGMGDVEGWRIDKKLAGGGPLMDVGIYCVQAARYTTDLEPIAVTATQGVKTKPEKFKTVEESLTWKMEFPGGIVADCKTSYVEDMNLLRAEAEKGWFELSPAYAYEGIKGKSSEGKIDFPQVNQQAKQMDDFAIAITTGRPTPVPGEMGRQDVKILQAIYKAMETGQKVNIT
jgi:predicted dehydrogenase